MAGLILSAPSSGSGKTTITLGLLRALTRRGLSVRGAKSGPDYIDPRFHAAACGHECLNLDAWAMSAGRIKSLAPAEGVLVIEGAMGLFDGAPPDGAGATADLARLLGLPVILIVDAARIAQSIAPLVAGFAAHDRGVRVGGVILNKVGSARHEAILRRSLENAGIRVFGAIYRDAEVTQPARHLGLVQASERQDLEAFIDHVADVVSAGVDIDGLLSVAMVVPGGPSPKRLQPPAQRIAIAQDQAFAFAYPHILGDWRDNGAEISFFSPLADELVPQSDFVFLPGGYPELHGARLASNNRFLKSLRKASQTSEIYGECGGYMVLGDGLVDGEGVTHEMAGLLRLETSFATRKLHLGYRKLTARNGVFAGNWKGHEFHYATTLKADGTALFSAKDAEGNALGSMGLVTGRVSGSFAHLIDRDE